MYISSNVLNWADPPSKMPRSVLPKDPLFPLSFSHCFGANDYLFWDLKAGKIPKIYPLLPPPGSRTECGYRPASRKMDRKLMVDWNCSDPRDHPNLRALSFSTSTWLHRQIMIPGHGVATGRASKNVQLWNSCPILPTTAMKSGPEFPASPSPDEWWPDLRSVGCRCCFQGNGPDSCRVGKENGPKNQQMMIIMFKYHWIHVFFWFDARMG
jgi:hypothetical protein